MELWLTTHLDEFRLLTKMSKLYVDATEHLGRRRVAVLRHKRLAHWLCDVRLEILGIALE